MSSCNYKSRQASLPGDSVSLPTITYQICPTFLFFYIAFIKNIYFTAVMVSCPYSHLIWFSIWLIPLEIYLGRLVVYKASALIYSLGSSVLLLPICHNRSVDYAVWPYANLILIIDAKLSFYPHKLYRFLYLIYYYILLYSHLYLSFQVRIMLIPSGFPVPPTRSLSCLPLPSLMLINVVEVEIAGSTHRVRQLGNLMGLACWYVLIVL